MGNRISLLLHAAPPPGAARLAEGSGFLQLDANNALPLFWLALVNVEDVRGAWAHGMRRAWTVDVEEPAAPLTVRWVQADANLRAAQEGAPARAPALAPLLNQWAAALRAEAVRLGANEVEMEIAEFCHFFNETDEFIEHVVRSVSWWQGAGPPPDLPSVRDPAIELGGFSGHGQPFPPNMPRWMPGHEPPPLTTRRTPWWNRFWASVPAGLALVGAGAWLGGLPGAAAATVLYALFAAWAEFRG